MNAVRRHPKEYARPPRMLGAANPRWVEPVTLTCVYCKVVFTAKPHRVGGSDGRGKFCSSRCRDEYRRGLVGPANPLWVGGPMTYRGRNWPTIRLQVVKEQGGRCAHCGKFIGTSLPVNHTVPFREFDTADEANVRSNLVGLCQPCHMKAEPRRHRKDP